MKNIKLIIEYDGTNYHGWQTQINAVTVQDVVKNKIESLINNKCILTGASRTDVGVHAFGQVANFSTNSNIPPERFSYALNRILPNDIVIKGSSLECIDFHSRFWAKGKKYKYLILNSKFPSAILKNRVYHVSQELNFIEIEKACKFFVGTHDFSAFRSTGSSQKSSVRTITELDIQRNGEIIEMTVKGDGFLYNMVRIIAGTLVDVGIGKINVKDIDDIIKSKDRKKAGKTLPAHGLYLVKVYY